VEVTLVSEPPVVYAFMVLEIAEDTYRVSYPVEEPASTETPEVALDTRRGFRLYNRSNFSAAATYFQRAARNELLSDEDRERARLFSRRIRKFSEHYQAGMSAAEGMRARIAIRELTKALTFDRRINRHFRARIRSKLAAMHTQKAGTAYQRGGMWEAARAARKALTYDRNHSGAKMILQKVEQRVPALLQRAQREINAGRKGAASRVLRQVMLIVGSSDPRHARAKRMLDSLR